MKRGFIAIILISLLQITYASTSHAVLGWSQCEKMWKQIDLEDAVGKVLWESFYSKAKAMDSKPVQNRSSVAQLALLMISLRTNNVSVHKIAMKNKECFSAAENANILTDYQFVSGDLQTWIKIRSDFVNMPEKYFPRIRERYWVNHYPQFFTFLSGLGRT